MEYDGEIPEGTNSQWFVPWTKMEFTTYDNALEHIRKFYYHHEYASGGVNVYYCVLHKDCRNRCKVIYHVGSNSYQIHSKYMHSTEAAEEKPNKIAKYVKLFAEYDMVENDLKPSVALGNLKRKLSTFKNHYIVPEGKKGLKMMQNMKQRKVKKVLGTPPTQLEINNFCAEKYISSKAQFDLVKDENGMVVLEMFRNEHRNVTGFVFTSRKLIMRMKGKSTCMYNLLMYVRFDRSSIE